MFKVTKSVLKSAFAKATTDMREPSPLGRYAMTVSIYDKTAKELIAKRRKSVGYKM